MCTAAVCESFRVWSILPYDRGVSDHRPIRAEIMLHSPVDSQPNDLFVHTPARHAVDPPGVCVQFEVARAEMRAAGKFRKANNGISLAADRREVRNKANRGKSVARDAAADA